MKKLYILMYGILFVALTNCTENDDHHPTGNEPLAKPAIMKVFCQASPNVCHQEIKYEYINSLLISETVFIHSGELYSQKTLEYHSNGQLKKEIYDMITWEQEKDFIYNEANQLEKIIYTNIYYNSDRQETYPRIQLEETFEYENTLLVKHVETWGGWDTYEYDTKGRMTTQTIYTSTGGKYHIINFKYSGNLKIEEWAEVVETGKIMYRHKFEYNKNSRLTKVLEDGKVIEENSYRGNQLIEKQTYYFGIDPCFSPCCGNYIYKYEY